MIEVKAYKAKNGEVFEIETKALAADAEYDLGVLINKKVAYSDGQHEVLYFIKENRKELFDILNHWSGADE